MLFLLFILSLTGRGGAVLKPMSGTNQFKWKYKKNTWYMAKQTLAFLHPHIRYVDSEGP